MGEVYWTKERAAREKRRITVDPVTGKYHVPINSFGGTKAYTKLEGTIEEVYNGIAFKTHNWVTREGLVKNRRTGKIGYINIIKENKSR